MKPELDREIDALLRSRAAGGARAADRQTPARDELVRQASATDSVASGAHHLDADELAAFAENALTDATRTRFVSHLADCDDCRRTATRLVLASSVSHARDEREAVAAQKHIGAERIVATSWRERFATLLAPRAWRYAMPVVALLCVGVIALVVMRRVPEGSSQLARNDEELRRAHATAPVAQNENHATAAGTGELAEGSTQTQSYDAKAPAAGREASSAVARRAPDVGSDQAASPPAANAVGGVAGPTPGVAPVQVETKRPDERAAAPPPAAAPSAIPPPRETESLSSLVPQPTPVPVNEDRIESAKEERAKKIEEIRLREQAQAKQRRVQSRDELDKLNANGQRDANRTALRDEPASPDASAGAAAKNEPKTAARRAAPARDEGRKDDDQPSDATRSKSSTTETRTVAGRKFRREGDAWIDTAYRAGAATTVVRRNSEQYRALVADEPEIARVAKAFGGEVVVVWKGRAYRLKP